MEMTKKRREELQCRRRKEQQEPTKKVITFQIHGIRKQILARKSSVVSMKLHLESRY